MTDEIQPGTLPEPLSQLEDSPFRKLVIEQNTNRADVVDAIVDVTGMARDFKGDHLNHLEVGRLLRAVNPDEHRTEYRIRRDQSKHDILVEIADHLDTDIDVESHQSNFRKGQLIDILLELHDDQNPDPDREADGGLTRVTAD